MRKIIKVQFFQYKQKDIYPQSSNISWVDQEGWKKHLMTSKEIEKKVEEWSICWYRYWSLKQPQLKQFFHENPLFWKAQLCWEICGCIKLTFEKFTIVYWKWLLKNCNPEIRLSKYSHLKLVYNNSITLCLNLIGSLWKIILRL